MSERVTVRVSPELRAFLEGMGDGRPTIGAQRAIAELYVLRRSGPTIAPRTTLQKAARGLSVQITKTPSDLAQELLPTWRLYVKNAAPSKRAALNWIKGRAHLAGNAAAERAEKILEVLELLYGGRRP